jgi:hypothetical protein
LVFNGSATPTRSLAPSAGPYDTCGELRGHCRYRGTEVPSILSQKVCPGPVRGGTSGPVRNPCPDQALTPLREKLRACHMPSSKGRFSSTQSFGSGSPRGKYSHTKSSLRASNLSTSRPALMNMWPRHGVCASTICMLPVLPEQCIRRSGPTRQHRVKVARYDDGHAVINSYVPPLSVRHPYCTNNASGVVCRQDNTE